MTGGTAAQIASAGPCPAVFVLRRQFSVCLRFFSREFICRTEAKLSQVKQGVPACCGAPWGSAKPLRSPDRTWFEQPYTFPRCLTLFCPFPGQRMLRDSAVLFYMDLLHFMNLTVILSHLVKPLWGCVSCVKRVSARSIFSLLLPPLS